MARINRYLDAPDIITGNTAPMDPAMKQRLLRHLDSCVSELDLDLGSRPDSGMGSSPGSVADRISGVTSPNPLDQYTPVASHCSTALTSAVMKSEISELETPRPDSSTTAGDENNNSSRPPSAFSQAHPPTLDTHFPGGIIINQQSMSGSNPNMLSVVQVIPSRLPDGQVVFLLPSHYVQLAAAAAANGISIGPNPPTAIWAATNMSMLRATDKLVKRPHVNMSQDWTPDGSKPPKSRRIEPSEQPLDFTTTSQKLKTRLELQAQTELNICDERRPSHVESEGLIATSPSRQVPVKEEEAMWRPW
ncbi:uncharacterized protein LOC107043445 [Diachasma alloeum]|uniref:uncharacterized protein LOC107043445 n=1 Tax=Diachasma alloeum TaxID=454923 RepID=UPI0007382182|nr:uncharacterized protein LOC107043445 [Diachasma alloeum]